ncbi:DNA polymerase III subunit gamma/tau [bacterium CG17_big_fil_post_rev_8_21_14_2_50_64_8]|nr:MAG: DNA polymerase III subunit gamma/tau [bacterium CG17_big_fil_post_rev_8_21_14_2_50_64_8]PJA73482.1 MAG: DNA polymerase III subunit gamma/tau [bacterium CG_4_9_14_3_um_filter_65_15]
MSYEAIARKYRPETFAQVVGQAHVTDTLRAAVRRDKLSHAYLFSGPRGCGKTTVARLLAKAINCPRPAEGDPCGECESCRAIARGGYLDVLEIDAASNTGVDNIRELRDMAQYSPSEGSSRVFIIDEVHMLSKGAFNALLKILEEPPARVFFFFATTEVHKIPRTIISRCQRFDFRLLSQEELSGRLSEVAGAEGVKLAPGALRTLVSLAEGSLRDGLSLLDQMLAASEGEVTEEAVVGAFGLIRSEVYLDLNDAVIARDPVAGLALVDDLARAGQSLGTFARGIVTNFRNLMLLKIDAELARMVDLPADQLSRLGGQAAAFSEQDLLALIERASGHFERIHRSTQPRILLEAAVVEYTRFESRVLLADLARRLGQLAPGAGGGASGAGDRRPQTSRGETKGGSAGTKSSQQGAAEIPAGGMFPSSPAGAAADTVPGWTRLIEVLMQKAPRVGACLMNGLPSFDPDSGRLIIAFAADKEFQVGSIRGDCDRVAALAAKLWQQEVRVELVLGERGQEENITEGIRREVAPTQSEELKQACAEDPALGSLVEMMDAAPLPDGERDRWQDPTD